MNKLANLNRGLQILISFSGALMLVDWLVQPEVWVKPLSYLATIFLPFVPDFFRLRKFEASTPLILAYEVFLIVAMVLGIDLNWYSEVLVTASNDSYYDKIVHFSSGILVVAAGQEFFELFRRQSGSKKDILWFQILFLVSAVALVAVGWECYEFLYDEVFGGHMQELVKSGVSDTMWDMIASLMGGFLGVFCILYLRACQTKSRNPAKKS